MTSHVCLPPAAVQARLQLIAQGLQPNIYKRKTRETELLQVRCPAVFLSLFAAVPWLLMA